MDEPSKAERRREEELDNEDQKDQQLSSESFSAHKDDGEGEGEEKVKGKEKKKDKEKWPEYTDGIFESDTPVFARLWEYVQRQLNAPGNHYAANQIILEDLRKMDIPEKGCKMAITLKDEEGEVYDDVLR